jgi:hypothetical protein
VWQPVIPQKIPSPGWERARVRGIREKASSALFSSSQVRSRCVSIPGELAPYLIRGPKAATWNMDGKQIDEEKRQRPPRLFSPPSPYLLPRLGFPPARE